MVHARRWTIAVLVKSASELHRTAASKPKLISEWLEELAWCRKQWPQEAGLFDAAIEKLHAARTPAPKMWPDGI